MYFIQYILGTIIYPKYASFKLHSDIIGFKVYQSLYKK